MTFFFLKKKFIESLTSLQLEDWSIAVSQWDQNKMVPASQLSLMRTLKPQDYLFSDICFWDMKTSVEFFSPLKTH